MGTSSDPNKLAIPCDCAGTCSVALITEWRPWKGDPQEFFVELYARNDSRGSLRYRLGVAWAFLRGKDPVAHAICLTDLGRVEEWRDFLSACLADDAKEAKA